MAWRNLAHLSRRLTRWAYSIPVVRRLSVICPSTLSELNISWGQLISLDQILYVALLGLGKGCIRSTLDQNWFPHQPISPINLNWGKCCPEDSDFIFYWIFIKLAGNEDSLEISDEFDFGPDQSILYSLQSYSFLSDENFSHRLIMEKMLSWG